MPGNFSGKVVPIRVTIGLRANGQADHPDWQLLPLAATGNPTDHMCGGWMYDKQSGHQEHSVDSPMGQQFGVLLVSEQFADEAVAKFPSIITQITDESELETFIEEHVTAHLSEFNYDLDELQALKTELDLLEATNAPQPAVNAHKQKIKDALDVTKNVRGKNVNRGKKYGHMKEDRSIDLADRVTPKR